MRMVEKMIERLKEEVDGAKEYAEKYIECKSRGNISRASRYKEMAEDELKHAGFIRDMGMSDIEELRKIYKMTDSEEELIEHSHKHINEQMAIVRYMLAM